MRFLTIFLCFTLSVSQAWAQAEETAAPTDMSIRAADTTVTLTWSDNATNESAYHVERKTDQWPWRPLATLDANSTSHVDRVESGHTYCYRVYATTAWISARSNEACIVLQAMTVAPAMPTNVKWLPNLVLTWDDVAGELGYHIECDQKARSSTPVADVPANVIAYHNNKTAASLTPCCTVRAWNQFGVSSYSDRACLR